MRALIQRVKRASVTLQSADCGAGVYGAAIGAGAYSEIGQGLCVFLGVAEGDGPGELDYIAKKISKLRIFSDEEGKMNRSVQDVGGQILLVSQFTLCADTRKGNRPSFISAEKPAVAMNMYRELAKTFRELGIDTREGVFGEDMLVEIANDGPVTIWIDSDESKVKARE